MVQIFIEPACLQALDGHFALVSPSLHLALPYGRFSPSRQDLRFAPLACLRFCSFCALSLTSMYARVRQFRKHCHLWRFIVRAHVLSFAPNMVPHISIEALCLRLRQCLDYINRKPKTVNGSPCGLFTRIHIKGIALPNKGRRVILLYNNSEGKCDAQNQST